MELVVTFQMTIFILVLVVSVLLAIYVHQNNKKSATNNIFSLLSLVVSVWVGVMYTSLQPFSPLVSLWWIRASICLSAPMSMLFFVLAHTLPEERMRLSQRARWLCGMITLGVMAVSLSPYAFQGIETINGHPNPVPGPGLALFGIFSIVCNILAVLVLVRRFLKSRGTVRHQLKLVSFGVCLMFTFIVTTIFIPVAVFKNNYFVSFAPIYVLLFLGSTAVAIVRYQLFNIKILATEAAVSFLVIILLFEGLLSGSLQQIFYKTLFAIVVGILGIILVRSVTREVKQREEVTHLAESLEKANLRLQELDQQKTEFLSIASHQLRTPLSILKGYIELIKDGAYGKPTAKMVATLDDMDESNERLVKLVDEFLDISRIEQGRTKFSFAPHNPVEVIDSIIKEIEERAKDKKLTLSWDKTGIGEVVMDEEKIRHVIFNFVDNAIKYSEQGTIRVFLEKDKDGMVLRVRDEGVGFNKTDEVNFYQKFYRGENVKNTNVNGTGLGLYVCRKFIEAHRGYVWAKSDGLGKGSEFGFWIPLK